MTALMASKRTALRGDVGRSRAGTGVHLVREAVWALRGARSALPGLGHPPSYATPTLSAGDVASLESLDAILTATRALRHTVKTADASSPASQLLVAGIAQQLALWDQWLGTVEIAFGPQGASAFSRATRSADVA